MSVVTERPPLAVIVVRYRTPDVHKRDGLLGERVFLGHLKLNIWREQYEINPMIKRQVINEESTRISIHAGRDILRKG